MDRAEIARLIDQLDHPDAVRQREVRDRLVALGPEAVEVINANLRCVSTRVRTGLVQVLADIGDERALLPLMRYVFDERNNVTESNARGLAMQSIMRIAQPRHATKLFDFLVDMRDDPDAFVRTYVIEAFGKLGDATATPYVREALDDASEFVRERAQKTLDELEMSQTKNAQKLSGEELLREIRSATGARLTYCVKLLSEHDDAFALASQLVREDGNRSMVGLQVLQGLDDPAARRVAVRHFQLTRSDADRAASLRLLAEHLDCDAEASELNAIKRALDWDDKFIELAALAAAARSGHPELTQRAVEATRSGDYNAAATASEALSKAADKLPANLADALFGSIQMVNGHRRHNPHEDLVRTEAYLLRALSKMLQPNDARSHQAQQAALASLRRSHEQQPIVITALEVLMRLTPKDGYKLKDRWHPADAASLVPLLRHANPSVRRRALEVIRRGAPGDAPNLSREFERLMRDDPALVSEAVIPAILETSGPNAKKQLAQLAVANEPTVRRAAESALRRLRNRQPHIDVQFKRARE
ncbi:HEAT repeat domain-containing protein [Persicimonas caeni]|nr:HEAT repeat domain-containing protein [Persicimonas caeni]